MWRYSSEQKSVRPTTKTTILDLNDRVLRETFQNLSASDLCAVADVCSTFKRNAQAEFALRFKVLYIDNCVGRNDVGNLIHFQQWAPALRNFGLSATSICIEWSAERFNQPPQLVQLLSRYCGESLKELDLYRINITADMIQKLQPLLSRLQILELRFCFFPSTSVVSEMFSFCTQLHTLTLSEKFPVTLGAPVALPKLKSLDVYCGEYSFEPILQFLALNPKLKEFKCRSSINSKIIPHIATYAPHIEKIKLKMEAKGFIENAKHLKRLAALKSLEINCGAHSFASVLKELAAAHIPLEFLQLMQLRWDQESVNEITKLKQLKKLILAGVKNIQSSDILVIVRNLNELIELDVDFILTTDLLEIVRCATKLQELRCDIGPAILDEDLFMKIRDVVAKRKEKCLLVLLLHTDKPDLPKKLLIENKDILKLE